MVGVGQGEGVGVRNVDTKFTIGIRCPVEVWQKGPVRGYGVFTVMTGQVYLNRTLLWYK